MTEGLKDIIERLEQQRAGIERALAALREIGGGLESGGAVTAVVRGATRAKKKGGMTPDGRRRLSESLKKRWAVKRAAAGKAPAGRPAKKKGGMTPEGRKRLSEALSKRWAAKRAASAVPAKRAAGK